MDKNCPYCGSRTHRSKKMKDNKVQRQCISPKCGKYFTTKDDLVDIKIVNKLPKILLLDIETAPLKAFIWQTQMYNINVTNDKIINEWFMLTWASKWLFSGKSDSCRLTSQEAKNEDDSRIVRELWNKFNEADIIVAHNGLKFDVPNVNSRFLLNGLPPCTPYQQVDTLKVAQKQFGFTHNSLNALAKLFGIPEKIDTDFELWKRCLDGNNGALKEMQSYNIHDVEMLEEVYLKLRPWIKSHPNVGLYVESDNSVCAVCGSDHLVKYDFYRTSTGKYRTYSCENCGALSRSRVSEYPKEKRSALLVSNAR